MLLVVHFLRDIETMAEEYYDSVMYFSETFVGENGGQYEEQNSRCQAFGI